MQAIPKNMLKTSFRSAAQAMDSTLRGCKANNAAAKAAQETAGAGTAKPGAAVPGTESAAPAAVNDPKKALEAKVQMVATPTPAWLPPPVNEVPESVAKDAASMKAYKEKISGTDVAIDMAPIPGGKFTICESEAPLDMFPHSEEILTQFITE